MGPHPSIPDAEAGVALAQLVHDQFTACGTTGDRELTYPQMRKALAALQAICARIGARYTLPLGDFAGFKAY